MKSIFHKPQLHSRSVSDRSLWFTISKPSSMKILIVIQALNASTVIRFFLLQNWLPVLGRLVRMENLQFMLLLARLFGCNTYLYHETNDGFVATLSWSGVCFYVVNILVYTYFSVANVLNPKVYTYTGSKTVDIAGKIILELGFCDLILIATERVYRGGWTTELLNAFRSVDKQIIALGAHRIRSIRNSEQLNQMILLTLCTISAIVYSVYAFIRTNIIYNIPMFVGHLLVGVSLIIITSIFYAEVYEIRYRLSAVNSHISKQLCDEDFHKLRPNYGRRMIKVSSNAEIKLRKDFIARVGLIYEELHSIATKISNRYLFEFSGYCIVNVFYGIMAVYIFYRAVFVTFYEARYSISIFLVWALIYKISLFQMIFNCHLLHAEGKRLGSIISYVASQENDVICIKKMHSLLCQIQHNPIKITTYTFDINLGVFFGIVSTILTYLFILLQFSL
uniref:Gustatory receptor n=2 Tax=gambiae species complex TaxID=44542 RepID=A0A2Y9D2A4_ANOGA